MPLLVKSRRTNSVHREPMRWLFRAYFADGTSIEQDQDDRCTTRADGSGSAFTDVLAREDELLAFGLAHTNGQEHVVVDLRSGAFIVNGTPLQAHNQYFEPEKYKLKLVFYRETRVDTHVSSVVQEDGSINQNTIGGRQYVNRYFIGWKAVVNGKDKQVTLALG